MIYGLIAGFLILWSVYMYHVMTNKREAGFIYKGFTSFMFIITGVYGAYHYFTTPPLGPVILLLETKYIKLLTLVILGLISGLIGDLFLEIQYFYKPKREYIIHKGMIIFLIGHLFYIAAISIYTKFNYYSLLIGLIMTIIIYFGGKIMKFEMGQLEVMSYIYTFVIFCMVGASIFQAVELSFNAYSLSFMIGAILFGISDLFLAPIYFKGQKSNLFFTLNLSTYYLGQLGIAFALFLF